MNYDCIVIFVTVPNKEEAEKISSALIEQELIACANILPGVSSVFKWKGEICREQEIMLIIKSIPEKFESIASRIKELHSYEVPEIIALPVVNGSKDYLDWVRESTVLK